MNPIKLHRELLSRGVEIEFTRTTKSKAGTFFSFNFDRAKHIEIIRNSLKDFGAVDWNFYLEVTTGVLSCCCIFLPSEG